MENSLDAAESIGVLPDISVEIAELSEIQFNKRRGVSSVRDDEELFRAGSIGKKRKNVTVVGDTEEGVIGEVPEAVDAGVALFFFSESLRAET